MAFSQPVIVGESHAQSGVPALQKAMRQRTERATQILERGPRIGPYAEHGVRRRASRVGRPCAVDHQGGHVLLECPTAEASDIKAVELALGEASD